MKTMLHAQDHGSERMYIKRQRNSVLKQNIDNLSTIMKNGVDVHLIVNAFDGDKHLPQCLCTNNVAVDAISRTKRESTTNATTKTTITVLHQFALALTFETQ